jgi:protein-S-isoprenylcysteine O-methyltransferase Ste14
MSEARGHPASLRRRVITLFYVGLLALALLALGIDRACGDWGMIHLGWLSQALGSSLTVAGFVLVGWSVRIQYVLGKGTPAPKVATQRLVTQGPYAYTRNPMTLGALLMYLGIGMWIESGVVVFLTAIVFSVLLTFIYFRETSELTERFGEEYLTYKQRTPFLLPRLWRRSDKEKHCTR